MIDRCEAATVTETDIDHSSTEDRRACESVAETPGDGRMLNVNGPLQLGGKSNTRTKYPNGLLRDGFNGCIKNFFHNGQVTALNKFLNSLFLNYNIISLWFNIKYSHIKAAVYVLL